MTTVGWLASALLALLIGSSNAGAARIAPLGAGRRLAVEPTSSFRLPRVPLERWSVPCAVGATVLVGLRSGVALAIASGAVLAVGLTLAFDASAGRREVRRRRELIGALRVLIGEVEAGAPPPVALAAAAAVTAEHAGPFRAAADAASAGGDAGAVLAAGPDTRAIGLAWSLGQDTGAAMGAVLGRVATDLVARDDQRRAVGVALSGPRSSAVVLAGLPVVGIALGLAMGAAPLDFLGGSSAGRITCCVGVLLDALGVLWMRRILRSAERG